MTGLTHKPRNEFNNQKKDVWVVIPAYNEEGSIGSVLDSLINQGYSILIVDDCSTDGTVKIVQNYPVTLLKHVINLGQGAALQTGFDYILNQTNARYVITFDADGQHVAEDIPNLIDPLSTGRFDIVLGSRFLNPDSVIGIPLIKLLTLKLGVLFTIITTGLKLTDTHNGLRGLCVETLRTIRIEQNGMAHASEILIQIAQNHLRFMEIPVTVRYTEYSKNKGQSILNSISILWDLFIGRN